MVGLPFALAFPQSEASLNVIMPAPVVQVPLAQAPAQSPFVYMMGHEPRHSSLFEPFVATVIWKAKTDREGALNVLHCIQDDTVRDTVAAEVVARFLSGRGEIRVEVNRLEAPPQAAGLAFPQPLFHAKPASSAFFVEVAREIKACSGLMSAGTCSGLPTAPTGSSS
jgi:hypothetical protein